MLQRESGRNGGESLSRYDWDSYDNALAESIIGLYKTEVIAIAQAMLASGKPFNPAMQGGNC